jgi:hypothetical protein
MTRPRLQLGAVALLTLACAGHAASRAKASAADSKAWPLIRSIPQPGLVKAFDLSPDGAWLAVACADQPVLVIWDVKTWEEKKRLSVVEIPESVAF